MESTELLQREVTFLKEQLRNKNNTIKQLEEMIKSFQQKRFGTSSEKNNPDQLCLFNEAEEIEQAEQAESVEEPSNITVASHTRKKKPRISIPDDLPREEVVYDIAESEKVCPHDGAKLKHIGVESHEQLDIIPAKIKVIKHIRKKYACPCCEQHMVTAEKPKLPIEKSIASPGLLAYIAVNKYCDHLPLYRQSEMFQRIGVSMDRTNLANWIIKSGTLVQPLINLIHESILEQPVVQMDETPLQVLNEPGKAPQSKSYMWLLASFAQQPAILFHYSPTRSGTVATELLQDYSKALMVDGYQGYQPACVQNKTQRLGCWAHARRKFIDAQKIQPKGKIGKADQAIAFIQKLYTIEKHIKELAPDKRYEIRQKESKPIVDKIKIWMDKSIANVPPKMALGKALYYLHEQWPRLIGYLDDGCYPIDNNLAENAIRPFTLGRKNWLFSNSQAGAKASANLFSLTETAKANGINPYDYLKEVFTQLPNATAVEDIESLLPWNYKADGEI
jgi:transposase